jgi:SAM-dependent methyltransferase
MRPGAPLSDLPPVRLFGQVDVPTWTWLNLEGREECPFLAGYLPSLPPDELQARISGIYFGRAGLQHAAKTYTVVTRALHEHGRPLNPSGKVLDFGCGWGRIVRYFLRDVEPENLWGIDVNRDAIGACRATNRWARFEQNAELPPSGFDDSTFDLVYGFSVFSHLDEESHLAWLAEFKRILKPGGVVVVTTLSRGFVEECERWARGDLGDLPEWQREAAKSFARPAELLAAYDRGDYCFAPQEGFGGEHFGLACISEEYIRRRWVRYLDVRDYSLGPGQIFIVCRK